MHPKCFCLKQYQCHKNNDFDKRVGWTVGSLDYGQQWRKPPPPRGQNPPLEVPIMVSSRGSKAPPSVGLDPPSSKLLPSNY